MLYVSGFQTWAYIELTWRAVRLLGSSFRWSRPGAGRVCTFLKCFQVMLVWAPHVEKCHVRTTTARGPNITEKNGLIRSGHRIWVLLCMSGVGLVLAVREFVLNSSHPSFLSAYSRGLLQSRSGVCGRENRLLVLLIVLLKFAAEGWFCTCHTIITCSFSSSRKLGVKIF